MCGVYVGLIDFSMIEGNDVWVSWSGICWVFLCLSYSLKKLMLIDLVMLIILFICSGVSRLFGSMWRLLVLVGLSGIDLIEWWWCVVCVLSIWCLCVLVMWFVVVIGLFLLMVGCEWWGVFRFREWMVWFCCVVRLIMFVLRLVVVDWSVFFWSLWRFMLCLMRLLSVWLIDGLGLL